MGRRLLLVCGLSGASAVAAGAIGAHAIQDRSGVYICLFVCLLDEPNPN